MFEISLLNPLRFIDVSEINYSFDGNFAVDQILSYQDPKCYLQKWQRSDVLKLQINSDFVPTDLLIKEIVYGNTIETVSWIEKPIVIVGETFKVYELEFDMSVLPEGKYFTEFSYTDEDLNVHPLQSEGIDLKDIQENTLLIKYKHSENDFSIIFETDIEFQFRVESAIKDFDPKNNRAVYNDQKFNSISLSATPFRAFKFWIGFQDGVPEWVVDKVNHIQSVDQVTYNNIFYQVPDEAEYEIERNDSNKFIGGSIDIRPANNNFSKYKTDTSGSGNIFIPMQKVIPYYNVSGNIPVANYFKNFSVLEKICIKKRSAPEIELLVGTTNGGDEIGSFTVDDGAFTQTIEWVFSASTTVYLTGLAGSDCDIFLIYKQLDEPPIDLGNGSGNTPPPVGKGAKMIYEEINLGDFDLDFDVATGLGRANTDWAGWVISGTNGTELMEGMVPIGFSPTADPDSEYGRNKIGTTVGANQVGLSVGQLPKVEVKTNGVGGIDGNPNGGGLGYANGPKDKLVFTFGNNEPHENRQLSKIVCWVTKKN